MVSITQGTRVFNRVHKEPSPVHVYKICEEAFMKQENTDITSIMDEILNLELDKPFDENVLKMITEYIINNNNEGDK